MIADLALDRQVLEGSGVGKTRDAAEAGLADPRSDTAKKSKLPDRHIHRLLVDELLHLIENLLALRMVELFRLFRKQLVDIGVVAISKGAILDHERGHPGGGVAKGGAGRLDNALGVFFAAIAGEKSGPLDRVQFDPHADRL